MVFLDDFWVFFTDLKIFRAFRAPFPHGVSSLRVLQLEQAALSINAILRINNRDLWKENTATQEASKSYSRHARKEGESKMHEKEQWSPNQLASRTSQIQHSDVSLVQEHFHTEAWTPAQSWVLCSKNLTSFRRAAAPGKKEFTMKAGHLEKCPSHDLVQWQSSLELSCKT